MGQMNEVTFSELYEKGKEVFSGKLDLTHAASQANNQCPEVAISSAKHYITWYSKMREGDILTWNSNTNLLLYYVERIWEDDGEVAGRIALSSAQKYALYSGKKDLEMKIEKNMVVTTRKV